MIRSVTATITRGASCVAAGAPRGYEAIVLLALAGCVGKDPSVRAPELRPEYTWSSRTDSNFASPIDLSVSGCRAAIVDFGTRMLLVKEGPAPWRPVGRQGKGPGEYELPGRVALLPGGGVVVFDQSQQRLIFFGAGGEPAGPPVEPKLPIRHPTGGSLVAINDSVLAAYEFSARVPWRPIPDSALRSIFLVTRIDRKGATRGGWGRPVPSPSEDATDVWGMNAGSIAIDGDRLLLLRRRTAVLEEYGLADGSLRGSDTLHSFKFHGAGAPSDGLAGGVAVLRDGRTVAILRGPPDEGGSGDGFSPEWLVVLDTLRHEVARYALTTRLTQLAAAGGSYLLALGNPLSAREEEGDAVVDLLLVPGGDSSRVCEWVPRTE